MNGRIKPRFEDLANAALQKPTYTTPKTAFVPPGGHELAIAEFQNMSRDIKRNQYDAATLLAKAQQIAQDRGVTVEIALDAIAREQSDQAARRDMAAQASASAAGQERYDLLGQDKLMGQLALNFRHNAQMSSIAQQIRASANPFLQMALENVPAISPASPAADVPPPSPGTAAALAVGSPTSPPSDVDAPAIQPAIQAANAAAAAVDPSSPVFTSAGAVSLAVPEDDIDMPASAAAAFTQPQGAPKDYLQNRQDLKDGLAQAVQNNPALLHQAIRQLEAWYSMARANAADLTMEQMSLLSYLQQFNATDAAGKVNVLQQLLHRLDMNPEVAQQIVAAMTPQFAVAPSKGDAPLGSDRNPKPKVPMADVRSGANLPAAKKAAVSGQAREQQLAEKTRSPTSSAIKLILQPTVTHWWATRGKADKTICKQSSAIITGPKSG